RPLTGVTVREVESRGKALLVRFDNGLNIYSHNQLYGRWYCGTAGNRPETRRQLRLEIRTAKRSALLYSASSMEVLTDSELGSHRYLCRLGPDLLALGTTPAQIAARLDEPGFRRRQLGGLLTDQSFVAGIGNYLRCEVLFSAGLPPAVRSADLGSAQRLALAREMLRLPRQSYRTGGITNDVDDAERLMASGAPFEAARFKVFRRAGELCRVCGKEIRKASRGGQACYWCPRCQAGAGAG
ncbi:MAG: endonuclease VIII, partial [Pseudomonadota bacterium]|nr:endonuclease VIII [Pseudomonadota bacterium]